MHIREASPADAGAISRLILPLGEKFIACDLLPAGARVLLKSFQADSITGYFEAGYRYHVAEEDGRLVGVVGVRDNCHLYHLFVDEAHHQQGIARRLWKVAHQAAITAGNPGRFTVNSSPYAVSVYRRLGFVETGPAECSKGVVCIPMATEPQ